MIASVRIPTNFLRMPLAERLRFFANMYRGIEGVNRLIVDDLEEAATEIELGERTRLTYRGGSRP